MSKLNAYRNDRGQHESCQEIISHNNLSSQASNDMSNY